MHGWMDGCQLLRNFIFLRSTCKRSAAAHVQEIDAGDRENTAEDFGSPKLSLDENPGYHCVNSLFTGVKWMLRAG